MKFFYGVIGLLLINSLYCFQEKIKIEAHELKTLNLSQIAASSESIVLEIPLEFEDRGFSGFALNQNYIFAMTQNKEGGRGKSIILQFQRNGTFIQQIGKSFEGSNSLFYDGKNNVVGMNTGDKIYQYNFQGDFLRETKAIGRGQIVYKERHYAVSIDFPAIGEPIDYTLIQSNEMGEKQKVLTEFTDNSKFTVGFHLRFSKIDSELLLWNHIAHHFFKIEDDNITVKYQLNVDKRFSVSATTMIIGNWLIFPAMDQKRRQSIVQFINLKSGEPFNTLDAHDNGIVDDISNNGFVKLHAVGIYGDVEDKIFFLKNVSDIESIKNDYPLRFKVLLIATLK